MIAFNVVRFRVKPGFEEEFVARHHDPALDLPGLLQLSLVRTGDASYCLVGQWRSMNHIAAARPRMISVLDSFRHMLEDLGGGLGVTDPVSGEAVVARSAPKPKKKAKAKPKPKRRAKKRAGRKKK
jgi:quinol monooxygenase YgiN